MIMCVYSPRKNMRELEGAVLGVIAAHEFLLALGQVERQAVAFREGAGHEDEERQRLIEDVPADAAIDLPDDDLSRLSEPGEEHDAEDGYAERDFVADDLCMERSEPSRLYLLFDCPAAEDDCLHRQARRRR